MTPWGAGRLRRELVDQLVEFDALHAPEWRDAFLATPRETFLPRFFAPTFDGRHDAIDNNHPGWLELVYRNAVWPTQLNGDDTAWERAHRDGPITGEPTCSSTMPSLMAVMLESLDIADGHHIIEIGTGTGYNAALLCHRLGHDNVTSIDIDRGLVGTAGRQLAACGYRPTLIVSDGASGYVARAPYDRLIATCSVPAVPPAWLDQIRPGGMLITHLCRELGGGALLRLIVDGPGSAHGRFLADYGNFMPTRMFAQAEPTGLFRGAVHQSGDIRPVAPKRGTSIADDSQPFVLLAALLMLGTYRLEFQPDGRGPQVWLLHRDGSWAVHDIESHTVEQYGGRRLWDIVEDIHGKWSAAGGPPREQFGFAISDGREWIWLDAPCAQRTWPIARLT